MTPPSKYTCNEYREEMILLGLKRRLADPTLSDTERRELADRIHQLEQAMGMD